MDCEKNLDTNSSVECRKQNNMLFTHCCLYECNKYEFCGKCPHVTNSDIKRNISAISKRCKLWFYFMELNKFEHIKPVELKEPISEMEYIDIVAKNTIKETKNIIKINTGLFVLSITEFMIILSLLTIYII